MNPEQVFSIAGAIAMSGWIALALLPGRRWVADVLCGRVLPAILSASYVAIVAATWGGSEGGFSSLADVALLFESRWLLLAGWIHYLAFDLFIGSWIARDARRVGVRHVFVVPCLASTFMFGPAGWLSYLVLRSVAARSPERASGALEAAQQE